MTGFPVPLMINYLYNTALQKVDSSFGTAFSKPMRVILRITNRCNLKCKMCRIVYKPHEKEMSPEQIKRVVLQLKKWLGSYLLIVSGGEPTLRKDVWEIMKFANNLNVTTMISTNGTLITKDDIRRIISSGVKGIYVGLDSLSSSPYQEIRGKNLNRKVLQTIDTLKRYTENTCIFINTVINKHNMDEIPKLIRFTKQKRLNSIIINPLSVTGRTNFEIKKELKHVWPNPEKVETTINKIIRYKKKGYPIQNSVKHLNLIKNYFKNPCTIKKDCLSPYIFKIGPAGHVFICNKRIGNVLKTTPKDIWNAQKNKKLRKELYKCQKSCAVMACYTKDPLITKLRLYKKSSQR